MLTNTEPLSRSLGDGLVLKSVADEHDMGRVADLNSAIHDPGVGDMARELILHHPDTRPEHWLYVEDTATSQVVSTICLIPWKLRYKDVTLNAGEVGLVGTLEPYRKRGLIRAQFARHAELLQEGGYDLSHIQGIPYFYRQFGYEYAMPLEGGWRVDLHLVPNLDDGTRETLTFRQVETAGSAGEQDLRTLVELYNAAECLLFPSHYEGFGVPVLEAMACGCPVVASDIPSFNEFAHDCILTAPANAPEALASSCLTLMEDAGLRSTLARNGLQRAQEYEWSNIVKKIVHLYEELVEQG